MTPTELSRTVLSTVRRAVAAGELRVTVPSRAVVERPRPGGRGDYATNIALQLAGPAGRPARQVAEILRSELTRAPGIADVEITGPGFLSITLRDAQTALVRDVLARGPRYGYADRPDADQSATDRPGPAGEAEALRLLVPSPAEPRAEVVAEVVVRLAGTQGGRAVIEREPVHGHDPERDRRQQPCGAPVGPVGPVARIRPVPADPDRHTPGRLGADAYRWALLHPAAHDRPRGCEDLLVQRDSNPLFRVRYAHARSRALLRNASELGFLPDPGDLDDGAGAAGPLLAALSEYPEVLAAAARQQAPDRLARHLDVVAEGFFRFHEGCRVLPAGEEKPSAAHRARLALAEAAGTVLAGGLTLLGVSAPESL